MASTKVELVEELRKGGQTAMRDQIIVRALQGYYHDFETPIAAPKTQLVEDLRAAGRDDLARWARSGYFDEPPPPRIKRGGNF